MNGTSSGRAKRNSRLSRTAPTNEHIHVSISERALPAEGVFDDAVELSLPDDSKLSEPVVTALFDRAKEYIASGESEPFFSLDAYLKRAEQLANDALIKFGLPTDIPRRLPEIVRIGEINVQDYRAGMSIAEMSILRDKDCRELRTAFDLKCAILMVGALSLIIPDDHDHDVFTPDELPTLLLEAMRVGRLMTQLEVNFKHGSRVDGKRKTEAARKKSMWTTQQREQIVTKFHSVRTTCQSNSKAWQATANELQNLTSNRRQKGKSQHLTAAMVRHILKSSQKK